jgi:hypothetical protein
MLSDMLKRLFAGALLFVAAVSQAGAWPIFSGPSPTLTLSPSASTIWGGWQTVGAGDSNLACTPHAGGSTLQAADNGVQTAVNNHQNIVAGLAASTLYDCSSTTTLATGGTVTLSASIATTAAAASTAITGVTYGSPVSNPASQSGSGDTYINFIADNNISYVTTTDGTGMDAACNNATMFYRVSNESNFTLIKVNCLTGYLGPGVCFADSGYDIHNKGILSRNGILYMVVHGEEPVPNNGAGCAGLSPPWRIESGQIIKSLDHGLTWANFQNPNTYLAAGAPTTPSGATMFGSAITMPAPSFIVYNPDDGTLGPRVDNADAYTYMTSPTSASAPIGAGSDQLNLIRIPTAKMPALNTSDVQYYKGGDGTFDAAWSSNYADAVPVLTDAGHTSYSTVTYIPKINRYVLQFYWWPDLNNISAGSHWYFYEAPHPWGTWTRIDDTSWIGGGTSGAYLPIVFQRSALSGSNLTILFTVPSGYFLWEISAQLLCGGSNC